MDKDKERGLKRILRIVVAAEQAARAEGPQHLRDLEAFGDLADVAEQLVSR